jgi:hypothetical protein
MNYLINCLISYLIKEKIFSSFDSNDSIKDPIITTEYIEIIKTNIIHKLIQEKIFESDINNNDTICLNKQKRNKRGHYRKYESIQLNKAVDSVLTGSMSVHKAGVYYGVPHSTLEYKVKERTNNQFDLFTGQLTYRI